MHDLLRSPTYGSNSEPSRHNDSTIQPFHNEQFTGGASCNKGDRIAVSASQPRHTLLGDFGPLWEVLNGDCSPASVTATSVTPQPDLEKGQPSLGISLGSFERPAIDASFHDDSDTGSTVRVSSNATPTTDARKRRVIKDNKTKHPSSYASQTSVEFQSFSILKRPSGDRRPEQNSNVTFDIPRTPTKTTTGVSGPTDTPKAKRKPRSRGKGLKNDPFSSEGSAGVDSDASFIFDRPISGKSDGFAFVPSQVGTPEMKNNQYDTPPSSYDDQDWALNTGTIQGLASGGTRIRSTLYHSFAERRAALMTRLLGEFPGYAKLASQLGQPLQASPNESIESQPIHIFVDMSNVRSVPPPQVFFLN